MRCAWLMTPLLVVLGCTHEVDGNSGFGSGGDGGSQSATDGAPTSASGGTGAADDSAGEAGSASAAGESGDVTMTGADAGESESAEATGEVGESGGGSSTGLDTSGDESSSGDDSGEPLEYDACGFPLDGPWIQIEYTQAGGTATSPSWSNSDTPGWGEAQWAASNASWPEVWDLYQNINVSTDPIGVLAVVGSSAQLQLMLGFEELIDYDSATVCVEGRSVSTSASVTFDAYNPLTGIGNTGTMAHDWNMHATGLDLGQCFEPGGGVQAVRLDAVGGSASLGVKRMRLVLHGAVY